MLMRGIEDAVLPYCAANGIGVIAYSPMQSGLLTGTMTRERIAAFPADDWRRNSAGVPGAEARPQPRARRDARAPSARVTGALPVRWRWPGRCACRRSPATIVGARSAAQVDGVIGAMTFRLSDEELAEIEGALPGSAGTRH